MKDNNSLKRSVKIVAFALIAFIAISMTSVTAYAGRTCSHSGCDRSVDSGSYCKLHKCGKTGCLNEKGGNGTIYCNSHARSYASSTGKKTCAASGCYASASGSGSYCYSHTCIKDKCKNKRVEDSNYCSTHEPKADSKKTGTSTKSKTNVKSTTKSKSSSSTSSSSKSKTSTSKSKSKQSTKKNDSYNSYKYKTADEFAEDKYEEFADFEDDYDDDDEAYDDAVDYWNDWND